MDNIIESALQKKGKMPKDKYAHHKFIIININLKYYYAYFPYLSST